MSGIDPRIKPDSRGAVIKQGIIKCRFFRAIHLFFEGFPETNSKQIATFKLVGSDAARGNEIKQLI